MRYQVGDVVRVREDIVAHKIYYHDDQSEFNTVTDRMAELAGQDVTIIGTSCNQYIVDAIRAICWTDGMFEDRQTNIELPSESDILGVLKGCDCK